MTMLESSGMRFSFRRTFLAGLFIVLPILVTLWILGFFFGLLMGFAVLFMIAWLLAPATN